MRKRRFSKNKFDVGNHILERKDSDMSMNVFEDNKIGYYNILDYIIIQSYFIRYIHLV